MTPSALAEELGFVVNRMRGITGLDVVPMVVVEGNADENLMSSLCAHGSGQVFIAGARNRVEELLVHLKNEPVEGCECVFLVDCDGDGKTVPLAREESLVVTQTCDIEADLVFLGVASRLASRFLANELDPDAVVHRACELAMVISTVRRAAHAALVPMKLPGTGQLHLCELPEAELSEWEETVPAPAEVLPVIAAKLGWTTTQIQSVSAGLGGVEADFSSTCLGKDALDALYRALQSSGIGEVRGWSRNHFHKQVFAEFGEADLSNWEVGRRLRAWQQSSGHELLKA